MIGKLLGEPYWKEIDTFLDKIDSKLKLLPLNKKDLSPEFEKDDYFYHLLRFYVEAELGLNLLGHYLEETKYYRIIPKIRKEFSRGVPEYADQLVREYAHRLALYRQYVHSAGFVALDGKGELPGDEECQMALDYVKEESNLQELIDFMILYTLFNSEAKY